MRNLKKIRALLTASETIKDFDETRSKELRDEVVKLAYPLFSALVFPKIGGNFLVYFKNKDIIIMEDGNSKILLEEISPIRIEISFEEVEKEKPALRGDLVEKHKPQNYEEVQRIISKT